jgi:hypothetical protein
MSVLGLVITDGVGYRNYVLSNFIKESLTQYEKVVIFSGIPVEQYPRNFTNLEIIELPVFVEKRKTWFYRKLKELSHLFLHKSKAYGIRDTLHFSYPKNNSLRSLLIKFIFFVSKLFHSEKNINFYEKFQFLSFKNDEVFKSYQKIIKENSIDLLFFTHQRPPFLAPFLYAAQLLKVKTSSFIFSWDNLASKGRMLGSFDSYLVWSNLMKKELLEFYPNTKSDQIKVVGTPQFEPYVMDEYNCSKEIFYKKFNLDISKKLVSYSCADASIGENDELHIRSVWNFVLNNPEQNLQLLVRTSPAEDGKRFVNLKNDFPKIQWNLPEWFLARKGHVENWSQRIPIVADIIDLKATLKYADVNVNMLSTMSLDFMLFDKPVVNTVFGNKENGLYNDQRFLNYVHYKHVVDSGAVTIATNEIELHTQLKEAIENPLLRTEQRKKLIDLEIGHSLEGTSQRIVVALNTLLK